MCILANIGKMIRMAMGLQGESDEKELIKWNVVNVEGDEAVLVSVAFWLETL